MLTGVSACVQARLCRNLIRIDQHWPASQFSLLCHAVPSDDFKHPPFISLSTVTPQISLIFPQFLPVSASHFCICMYSLYVPFHFFCLCFNFSVLFQSFTVSSWYCSTLQESQRMQTKLDALTREVFDLQETINWKDKKIGVGGPS